MEVESLEDRLLQDDPPASSAVQAQVTTTPSSIVEREKTLDVSTKVNFSKCRKKNLKSRAKRKAKRHLGRLSHEGDLPGPGGSMISSADPLKAAEPDCSRGPKTSKGKQPYRPMPRTLFTLAWDKINQGLHLQREGLEMMRFYRFDG